MVPTRDLVNEDRWESDEAKPGKFIPVNDGDENGNQVPGYADGFGKYGKPTAGGQFVPAILDVSNTMEMIDWDKALIRFKYSASDPKDVKEEKLASDEDKKYYTVAEGMIRIWTKKPTEERNYLPVDRLGRGR